MTRTAIYPGIFDPRGHRRIVRRALAAAAPEYGWDSADDLLAFFGPASHAGQKMDAVHFRGAWSSAGSRAWAEIIHAAI